MHIYIYTCLQTLINSCLQTLINSCLHTRTNSCLQTLINSCLQTLILSGPDNISVCNHEIISVCKHAFCIDFVIYGVPRARDYHHEIRLEKLVWTNRFSAQTDIPGARMSSLCF